MVNAKHIKGLHQKLSKNIIQMMGNLLTTRI